MVPSPLHNFDLYLRDVMLKRKFNVQCGTVRIPLKMLCKEAKDRGLTSTTDTRPPVHPGPPVALMDHLSVAERCAPLDAVLNEYEHGARGAVHIPVRLHITPAGSVLLLAGEGSAERWVSGERDIRCESRGKGGGNVIISRCEE